MDRTFPLHSPDFYRGDPHPVYRILRKDAPVYWCDEGEFWAVSKYEDVRFISRNPGQFTSTKGIIIPDRSQTDPVRDEQLVFTDPPVHRLKRQLISSGFTPRRIRRLEEKARVLVDQILDPIERGTTVDFAESVAAPLPTWIIAELLGAPPEDWEQFRAWSDAIVGSNDPDIELDSKTAGAALFTYFSDLLERRRAQPEDDLISVLLEAEVDGERLSQVDLLGFCFLLLVAGNETTRNLISQGMLALIAHPDQRQRLVDDPGLIPSAVEEMLRFASPVTHMARTATSSVELRGTKIDAGQMVVMLYGAANRDEDVFGPTAEEFLVTRSPNPHLAFGFAEHLCLGASLARLEARVMFEELLRRFDEFDLAGEVVRMRATMTPGVTHMPLLLR